MVKIRSTWRVLSNIVWMPEYVMGIVPASLEQEMEDEPRRIPAQVRYARTASVDASNVINN